MLRMLQLSIIVSRIASNSRVIGFNAPLLSTSKRCVTTAWVTARNNDDGDNNAQKQRQPIQPEVRYRSKLAELYDDMFEQSTYGSMQAQTVSRHPSLNDKNADNLSSTVPFTPSNVSTPPTTPNSSSKDNNVTNDFKYSFQDSAKQDPKSTSRTFVKPKRSIPKAVYEHRKFKTLEYDNDEIGDYMNYMENNFDRDSQTPQEDKDVLTLFEEVPSLESFPDSSLQPPRITPQTPPLSVPKRKSHYDQKETPSLNVNASEDGVQTPIQEQTSDSIESDLVPSKFVTRSINTTLQAGSRGIPEPYSTQTLQSQIKHIESEITKLNNGVSINMNSRKQLSLLLFGVPDESTSKDVLEGIAGNIANTDGRAKIASLILQYRKFVKDLKRLERQNQSKQDGSHIASVHGKDHISPGGKRVQENSIVASNGAHREPLVLIDASAYIFRSYYAMPPMHRYDGEPVGATLGVCNLLNKLILNSLLKGEQPRVAMVFDSKDGTNFRKILYPDYKANRQACPEDLVPQFDFVKEAADAYGILTMEAAGYEADDVIATIATRAMEEGTHVNILSGDKDLMQLVTIDDGGACIELIDPMKMVRFSHEKVIEQWGVEPSQLADVLALAGDSSDNIPGVPGIGPKIAATLIQEYGTLENVLDHVDDIKQKARKQKIKENVENAILSRQLVELERNIPSESITFSSQFDRVSDFRTQPLQIERLLKFYDLMGFKDLKARVKSRLPIIGTNDGRYSDILDKKAGSKSMKNIDRNETYRRPPSESDFADVPF